jgi:hypothetical protein
MIVPSEFIAQAMLHNKKPFCSMTEILRQCSREVNSNFRDNQKPNDSASVSGRKKLSKVFEMDLLH